MLPLRILTINTHKGFSVFNRKFILSELREAVREVSADIVFLQEVLGSHEKHQAQIDTWPSSPQYEFLADTMWPEFAYGRNAVYPHGHHGNALLSKFPIEHYCNHDTSFTGHEKRGLLHCILAVPDPRTKVHVICVHLGLLESHRRQQMTVLCRLIDSLSPDATLIVAGDFNDWRQHMHKLLDGYAGLSEVFYETYGAVAKTFPARWPLLRLDRIYVRHAHLGKPVVLPRRPWSHLSDHTPLAVEITL